MIKAFGKIENGKLLLNEKTTFAKIIKQQKNQEIEIVIKKRKKNRSGDQNAYYWGVVVFLCTEELNNLGHEINNEETHQFLKANFNYKEIINETTGEIIKAPMSTTNLSTEEFNEYIEKVVKWAAEWLKITIPQPNEQTTIPL